MRVIELPVYDDVTVVPVVLIVVSVWLVVCVSVLVCVTVIEDRVTVVSVVVSVVAVIVRVMVVLVVVMQHGSAQTVPQVPNWFKASHCKPAPDRDSQVAAPKHAVVHDAVEHAAGLSTSKTPAAKAVPIARKGHAKPGGAILRWHDEHVPWCRCRHYS